MEQVGQGMGREIGESLGTVESVVDALCAPPAVLNCKIIEHERLITGIAL